MLEPGSLTPGSPGYLKIVVSALGGVSAFGATLIAAATAAAARGILGAVSLSGDTMTGPLVTATGTGAPNTAGLKIASAPLLLTPEAGAFERLADNLYITDSTGTRRPVVCAHSTLVSGQIPVAYTGGRLLATASLVFDWATGNITSLADLTVRKLGVGVTAPSYLGTKLIVGSSAGGFGSSAAAVHIVDNSLNATVNYQNTNAAGYAAFEMWNSSNQRCATFAWSNASAGVLPSTLWLMTRIAADMVLGTNNTERLRIKATGEVQIASSLAIGTSGTAITQTRVYTPSLSPALVSAGAPVEQTFAVAGLSTSDTISVNAPAMAIFNARVSAADTLALTFFPPAAGSYTPPAGIYRIIADRS